MSRLRARLGSLGPAGPAVVLAILMLIGALVWFAPFLLRVQTTVADTPAPPALFAVTRFTVPPHAAACEDSITVTPDSREALFRIAPVGHPPGGGSPVTLTLTAPGYQGTVAVGGGYPGGAATLPIVPPPRTSVLATACFVNHGPTAVALDGTTETRTMSRTNLQIAGNRVLGDIALTFRDTEPHRLIGRLGVLFGHASNLTDGLVPVWLIWIIAVLTALGVPLGVVAAFFLALRADLGAAGPGATDPRPRTAPSG